MLENIERRKRLLIFEDAVGVTKAYRPMLDRLLIINGVTEANCHVMIRSSYKKFLGKRHLMWKKPRKQPGFNNDPRSMAEVRFWVLDCIEQHKPDVIVCFDPALLFLLNPDWAQATLDTLRGGLYIEFGIPWIVTMPLTAFHTRAKSTDIAKLNDGFVEKGEFEDFKKELDYTSMSEDSDSVGDGDNDSDEGDDEFTGSHHDDGRDSASMEWHEPIVIPFGRMILEYDFAKVARILSRVEINDKSI
jgi:hypothetical protein